jgi:hypothetical protein
MYTLGSEHQFLYLSAHGARHGWFRLRWLVDIDRLAICAVDWEALLPMMRRYGGLPAGGQAWALAAALLGTPIPEPMRPVSATRQAHRLALSALAFMQASVPALYPITHGSGTGRLAPSELLHSRALAEQAEAAPPGGGPSVCSTSGEAAMLATRGVTSITEDASNDDHSPMSTATSCAPMTPAAASSQVMTKNRAVYQPVSRTYLLSLKEPRHRLWYLISRLFPSTGDSSVFPLPRQLHFLYIPLRPFLWLKRRFSKH